MVPSPRPGIVAPPDWAYEITLIRYRTRGKNVADLRNRDEVVFGVMTLLVPT